MIEIKYTTRVFPQKTGAVAVRVRWNHKKNEVEFPTGDYADPEKWNATTQRAMINTKHVVRRNECSAGAINKRIGVVLGYVNDVFKSFALKDAIQEYGVGEDAWAFWDKTITAATVDDLIKEMDYLEAYLIAFYNSYHDGYNSNAGGLGRGSKGQVSVSRPGYDTVIYDSVQEAAEALGMSPGIVYYYVHNSKTHKKKENGYVFGVVATSWTTSITTQP